MPELTPFATAAAVAPVGTDADGVLRCTADIPSDWAQGRTAFGGLTGAVLIEAVERLPEVTGMPVRSLDAAFVGPVPSGAVALSARVLRRGRYVTHSAADLIGSDGETLARLHAVHGALRDSAVTIDPDPPVPVPLEQCLEMPHIDGITPDFARNFEVHFATGIPFTGSSDAAITGWCRHRTPAVGAAAVAALVDVWPGSVLPVLTAPAPASTVRWSLQFPAPFDMSGDEWFWYESDTVTAQGGYSTMTARLWHGDRLISWSEQLLTVFDRR